MQELPFREYLHSRGFSEGEIDSQITFIEVLETDIKKIAPYWTLEDLNHASVQAIVNNLIDRGENTLHNLQTLVRYAKVINNDELFVSIFQMLDGCEAMDRLYDKIADYAGEDLRDVLFEEMPLPPLGLSLREKSLYTYRILHRMESIFEESTCREILKDSLRDLPEALFSHDKIDFYEKCQGDIDQFLILKGQQFLKTLKTYQEQKELFFGQEITDDVIIFVQNNPEIGQGIHEDNLIYETKIPFRTQAFIEEADPNMKRYYYCHCPWARESLRKKTFVVSSTFCQCSAGFHKRRYEVIFNQPLRADVINSVLKGDMVCRFAIHLPEDY